MSKTTKALNSKNQKKALGIIIELCSRNEHQVLYEPVGFADHFPFLDAPTLSTMLDILEDKELIHPLYGNYPDSFNIYRLAVTPKGYDYLPQASFDNKERWKERIWGFLSGSLFTSFIAFLIQKFV